MLALLGCACVRQSPRKINSELPAGRHTPAAAEPRGASFLAFPRPSEPPIPTKGWRNPTLSPST